MMRQTLVAAFTDLMRRHNERVFVLLLASLMLLRCGVARCPEGTQARFDQCIRAADGSDAAAQDAQPPHDGGRGNGDTTLSDADSACGVDRMWRDGRCVLREIYVDALDGNDAHEGTLQNPLKTFKRAVAVAVGGQVVNFEAREYATTRGDDFTLPVPDGVTLRTRPDSLTRARFSGDGVQSLTFAGRATLDFLELTEFKSVIATTDEQQLQRIAFVDVVDSLTVSGQARMRCDRCSISTTLTTMPAHRLPPLVLVKGSATLTLTRGSITGSDSAVRCEPPWRDLIDVIESGNLMLENQEVFHVTECGLNLKTQGKVRLVSSTLRSPCRTGLAMVWDEPEGRPLTRTLEIEDSTFHANVELLGSMHSVRVRKSEFRGRLAIFWATSGTYDFGLPHGTSVADVGWNAFELLTIHGGGISVSASGNQWRPSMQGADENGHYAPGDTQRVNAGEEVNGANFSLIGDGGPVELRF